MIWSCTFCDDRGIAEDLAQALANHEARMPECPAASRPFVETDGVYLEIDAQRDIATINKWFSVEGLTRAHFRRMETQPNGKPWTSEAVERAVMHFWPDGKMSIE